LPLPAAQDCAVAKLIQGFDNLSVTTRQALPASLRFTYHKEQFGEPASPFHGSRAAAHG
jgi:hypothetical protein